VRELDSAILEFIDVHNEQPKPFVWTKSANAILNGIGRFASRTLAAHGTNNMQEISDSGGENSVAKGRQLRVAKPPATVSGRYVGGQRLQVIGAEVAEGVGGGFFEAG
jgi:hypothetical protein